MRKSRVASWISVLLLGISCQSLAVEKSYQTGILVGVQQKFHTRVLYYIVNTPIEQEDPYFEVAVKVNKITYVGEYIPQHSSETLPDNWKPDEPVQVRVDEHYLFLKRPNGTEMKLVIDSQTPKHPANAR